MNTDLIYTIIQSALILLVSGLIGFLVKKLTDRFFPGQIKLGKDIAVIAVKAIEQIAERFGWKGEEKYNEAVKYFTELANKAGLKFSEDQIRALIESAVLELNKAWENLGK